MKLNFVELQSSSSETQDNMVEINSIETNIAIQSQIYIYISLNDYN